MTILTTHVGSLPRSQEVVDFIFTRERGDSYDLATFDRVAEECRPNRLFLGRKVAC